ncbi:MAG: hypothetical protein AAGM38_03530 [Pseudomonadota bacterium]
MKSNGGKTAYIAPNGLAATSDQIIFHFDGNNNDSDDIAALPIAALLSKAAGIEDKITLYFGNNLSEKNETQLTALRESAAFAESIGVSTVDYQANIAGATASLAALINSGQTILFIEGGPMEALYRALDASNSSLHGNVTLVSHASWNETRDVISRPGVKEARTLDDIEDDFPSVRVVEISDQNKGKNNSEGFYNSGFSWMDGSGDSTIAAAREAMKGAGKTNKLNDASDTGMLYYALTGDQNGDARDVRAYLESSSAFGASAAPEPDPAPEPEPEPEPVKEPVAEAPIEAAPEPVKEPVAEAPIEAAPEPVKEPVAEAPIEAAPEPVKEPVADAPIEAAPIDEKAGLSLLSFFLADAKTSETLAALADDEEIPAALLAGREVTVFAEATGGVALGSVKLTVDGHTRLENAEPYALFGDKDGDFFGGRGFEPGVSTIEAVAYAGRGGSGGVLERAKLSFEVVEAADAAPAPIASPPVAADPIVEEPIVEEPIIEAPVAEQPVVKTPIEEPIAATPDTEDEAAAPEAPVVETPRAPEVVDQDDEARTEAPEPAAPAEPATSLLALYLVDVDTGETLAEIGPNDVVPASLVAGRDVTFAAELVDGASKPASVSLSFEGETKIEKQAPYTLFGDYDGEYFGGVKLSKGGNTVDLAVYGDRHGQGTVWERASVTFDIVDDDAFAEASSADSGDAMALMAVMQSENAGAAPVSRRDAGADAEPAAIAVFDAEAEEASLGF